MVDGHLSRSLIDRLPEAAKHGLAAHFVTKSYSDSLVGKIKEILVDKLEQESLAHGISDEDWEEFEAIANQNGYTEAWFDQLGDDEEAQREAFRHCIAQMSPEKQACFDAYFSSASAEASVKQTTKKSAPTQTIVQSHERIGIAQATSEAVVDASADAVAPCDTEIRKKASDDSDALRWRRRGSNEIERSPNHLTQQGLSNPASELSAHCQQQRVLNSLQLTPDDTTNSGTDAPSDLRQPLPTSCLQSQDADLLEINQSWPSLSTDVRRSLITIIRLHLHLLYLNGTGEDQS